MSFFGLIRGFRSSDSTAQPLRLDKATNTLQVIDYAHHKVHEGSHFFYTDTLTLGNGASQEYLITTPNTTLWAHMSFNITFNDGAGLAQMYEGADRTGTTAQTIYNNNSNSATTATITIHKGTSGGTTNGTLIDSANLGSGKSYGGTEGSSNELILKQNTKYLIKFTNSTASDNIINFRIAWYEHTSIA